MNVRSLAFVLSGLFFSSAALARGRETGIGTLGRILQHDVVLLQPGTNLDVTIVADAVQQHEINAFFH